MKINYDPVADALSITIKKGRAVKTIEIAPEVNLDVDKSGNFLYLEIIGAGEKIGAKQAKEILAKNLALAG